MAGYRLPKRGVVWTGMLIATKSMIVSMGGETPDESLPEGAHSRAAEVFVERARAEHGEELVELCVFGSTVRGEVSGRSSDVEVLKYYDEETVRTVTHRVLVEFQPFRTATADLGVRPVDGVRIGTTAVATLRELQSET